MFNLTVDLFQRNTWIFLTSTYFTEKKSKQIDLWKIMKGKMRQVNYAARCEGRWRDREHQEQSKEKIIGAKKGGGGGGGRGGGGVHEDER